MRFSARTGSQAVIRGPARGPRAWRSRLTWLRSVAAAPGGGDPSHTASASASGETGTLADSSKLASRARWRAPDTATGSPAPPASISVPSNAKRTPLIHASLSLLSQRRIRAFHANRTRVARRCNQNCTPGAHTDSHEPGPGPAARLVLHAEAQEGGERSAWSHQPSREPGKPRRTARKTQLPALVAHSIADSPTPRTAAARVNDPGKALVTGEFHRGDRSHASRCRPNFKERGMTCQHAPTSFSSDPLRLRAC